MAVGDRDVELRVVVRIQEGDTEADVRERGEPDAARARGVLEESIAKIPKQAVGLEVEVGDHHILSTVAIVVAGIDAHPRPSLAVAGDRHTRTERGFHETQLAGVAKQEVGDAVVGDEHVGPAVIVIVGDDDAEAVAAIGADARRGTDVGEDAASVVAIERVRQRAGN